MTRRSLVRTGVTSAVPPHPDPVATDPDIDLHVPAQRRELLDHPATVLATIATGGALGALARYAVSTAMPAAPGAFPLGIFLVNVAGCFAIGVLMVSLTELRTVHRLVRLFLGVGVLGGFTTFSTYIVDFQRLVTAGAARIGLGYLAATALAALVAVWLGATAARRAASMLRRRAAR